MSERHTLGQATLLDGKYRIERVLGMGGFGVTYLALHEALGRRVAIKEFFPVELATRHLNGLIGPLSERDRDLFRHLSIAFLKEARTVAQFNHPAIVRVTSVFEANGTAYIVMPFEEGPSLKAWLASLGRSPSPDELDQILYPLVDALEVIHAAHYLHRDIAPDNILIRDDGAPVLIDFGAARPVMTRETVNVTGLVKRGFSPPEQYATDSRVQGPWTDIYALAATLYQCIAGRPPADATERILKDDYTTAVAAGAGRFRPSLLKAIDWALEIKPKDRPQSIEEWRPMLHGRDRPETTAADSESEAQATAVAGAGGAGSVTGTASEQARSDFGSAAPAAPAASLSRARAARAPLLALITVLALGSAGAIYLFAGSRPELRPLPPVTPSAPTSPPTQVAITPPPSAAAPPTAEPAPGEPKSPVSAAVTPPPRDELSIDFAGRTFRDCATCPEMVVVPAGTFQMGSPDAEIGRQANEGPQRSITFGRPFALARSETTVGAWRRFSTATQRTVATDCRALQFRPELIDDYEAGRARGEWASTGAYSSDNPNYAQTDAHPVVCISFGDAEAYLGWLSAETRAVYRLPTEAEWEFAARAGTTTAFAFGDRIRPQDASYHYPSAYAGGETGRWTRAPMPAGTFPANRLGLVDMHGNIWEWTQDCAGRPLVDLDSGGRAFTTPGCEMGVMRGGAYWAQPEWLRSAFRYAYQRDRRGAAAGFRSARELTDSEISRLDALLRQARDAVTGR